MVRHLALFSAALIFIFLVGLWCPMVIAAELSYEARDTAVLRTLDKVTARTSTLAVPVGQTQSLGTLAVTVQACQQTPPEEQPEAAAFVEIVDRPPERQPEIVFTGWMFASSPALSALQHPIYDVWVIGCKTVAKASSADGE
ncbi:MAG: DUF2155 domain-containing protein [Pseudomonadota bacterium]